MTSTDSTDSTDEELSRLVAADPGTDARPDVARLLAAGRRRLRVRRAIAAAAAVVVVAGSGAVLTGLGDDAHRVGDPAGPPRSVAPSPTDKSSKEPLWPRRGEVRLDDGTSAVGEWEAGEVLGERLPLGTFRGVEQVLYAARGPVAGTRDPLTYVAVALVDGDRLLRVVSAVSTDMAPADGVALFDGAREEEPGRPPFYRLIGLAPEGVDVTVSGPDGATRPVTTVRRDVLPGATVFVDEAAWQPDWDPLQIAPLSIMIDGGAPIAIRERSYA